MNMYDNEKNQRAFEIIMRKLSKIQEYNKILDVTNQLFEKRLNQIEKYLKIIDEKIDKFK